MLADGSRALDGTIESFGSADDLDEVVYEYYEEYDDSMQTSPEYAVDSGMWHGSPCLAIQNVNKQLILSKNINKWQVFFKKLSFSSKNCKQTALLFSGLPDLVILGPP